jgi:hypothetical protein
MVELWWRPVVVAAVAEAGGEFCARGGERGARQQGLDLDQSGAQESGTLRLLLSASALGEPTATPETK